MPPGPIGRPRARTRTHTRPHPPPRTTPRTRSPPPRTTVPPRTTIPPPRTTVAPVTTPPKSMKERLKDFRKDQLKRDLNYESGRREVAHQLPVRRTHSLVTNIIGINVPKPMWERGGGRRSYTSTYKSRRQARSSAHRAKLQRGGY